MIRTGYQTDNMAACQVVTRGTARNTKIKACKQLTGQLWPEMWFIANVFLLDFLQLGYFKNQPKRFYSQLDVMFYLLLCLSSSWLVCLLDTFSKMVLVGQIDNVSRLSYSRNVGGSNPDPYEPVVVSLGETLHPHCYTCILPSLV